MPEQFNFKVGVPGGNIDAAGRKKIHLKKSFTLSDLIVLLKKQDWDDEIKDILIKKASLYPHSALESFVKNINSHLNAAIKERLENE